MKILKRKDCERGQILLIVVLVMVVTLTIGLSVVTRTITSLRTVEEEASSERAFSAAEAGIERALVDNAANSGSFSNATYTTSVIQLSGVEFLLGGGSAILRDDAVDIWLSNYPNYTNPWTGNLTIYWGQDSDTCNTSEESNTMAALEVILVKGTKANPQTTHYALDPCSARASKNKFEFVPAAGGDINGKTFQFKKTIAVSSGLFLRIVPLYAPTLLAAKGCDGANSNCSSLPSQGTVVEAIGKSDTTVRRIISYRSYPKLPIEIFPFVLFSPK